MERNFSLNLPWGRVNWLNSFELNQVIGYKHPDRKENYIYRYLLSFCLVVSNKRQDGWTNRTQIFSWQLTWQRKRFKDLKNFATRPFYFALFNFENLAWRKWRKLINFWKSLFLNYLFYTTILAWAIHRTHCFMITKVSHFTERWIPRLLSPS